MKRLSDLIKEARGRLKGVVTPTPLVYSASLSRAYGLEVYLKAENLQKTGSFKARGAYNKIQSLQAGVRKKGVITASSGNHAQGVAWAASLSGVKATVVMPETASIIKRVATSGYGANVILHGMFLDEAYSHALRLAKQNNLTFISPYDDDLVMAGQGTIGLEILDSLPEVDAVVIPVGGGGLISGIAAAIKDAKKRVRVIGVQAEASDSCMRSLKKGYPVDGKRTATIADGIAVKRIGDKTFPVIKRCVDDCVAVSEDSIAGAVLKLMERKKLVVEGAGATPLAALMEGKVRPARKGKTKVVLVLSGGNIDVTTLDRIIRLGLIREGRVKRLSIILPDVPGSLAGLTREVAALKANILHVIHLRDAESVAIGMTRLDLILEVEGHEHSRRIARRLKEKGYDAKG
ncbi:MAG: threonine ammonia-lyase [Deltaproteobacteria bacterium]|nr:threonine ammonia-lyase [Deltaproteobacteria bacterium]